MNAIERPPKIDSNDLINAITNAMDGRTATLVDAINNEYEYWDTVKYKKCPKGCSPKNLWAYVKASRMANQIVVWDKYNIVLSITNRMQRLCHAFDMNFGGSWSNDALLSNNDKEKYLVSSLMEEAIFSSQMEGAATTRQVAKEMLRKKIMPKDKSQQMIANNYHTIRFIVQNKNTPLTTELLSHIHYLMTENTLQNPDEAGRFRTSDDVVVENGITHDIVHCPPSCTELPQFIDDLCIFFNDKNPKLFIHPIIRGIIIHFMIAYMHPFVDGNGRTARALFYWYMLKNNYWLTEYMSISRVIAKSKKSYEKAFLYTEFDDMDLGYFVSYNMHVLESSFKQLQAYLQRKQNDKKAANIFLQLGDFNERQTQIIKIFVDNPKEVITVKDMQIKFLTSATTAKSDIIGLVNRGLLTEISFNKVKRGYIRNDNFDEIVSPFVKR